MPEKPAWPTIHTYSLPDGLVGKNSDRSTGQDILHEVLLQSLYNSPHYSQTGADADFFYVPVPFGRGGRGRASAAAVLTYLRTRLPYFNQSLRRVEPNHLLIFTGDMAMDLPPGRRDLAPLPTEIDTASPLRHFIALTLTGNPEVGFQRGKDIVLPPTHNLKGGPGARDRCCTAADLRRRAASRVCKPLVLNLSGSPWRPLTHSMGSRPPVSLAWAGQASGGGMGRHGGSGPRVRGWLSRASEQDLPDRSLITDSNSLAHRRRNVHRLPREALVSVNADNERFGFVRTEHAFSTFCLAPYGRGNGWEGRSAVAIRTGCIPVSLAPSGSDRALESFVPWERFSLFVSDSPLKTLGDRLRRSISNLSETQINAMSVLGSYFY